MTSRLPAWFKQDIPSSATTSSVSEILKCTQLQTVCTHARCPNISSCWAKGVATFMILGDVCTRSCRFCAVKTGFPLAVDPKEPSQIAWAVKKLSLNYVVVTSVTRDDLSDGGSEHFANVVRALKEIQPSVKVEALIPDFFGMPKLIHKVILAGADVVSHNMETVKRLTGQLRPQADYDTSLRTIEAIKQSGQPVLAKSGFMVGLGESFQEVKELMQDLVSVGCDLLTIGQYLAPEKSQRHVPVTRFVCPDEFKEFKEVGLKIGFKHVLSAPLVRSSFLAEEGYQALTSPCFNS